MKPFINYTLLSCLILPLVTETAMGQLNRRANTAPRANSTALLTQADAKVARMLELQAQYVATETPKRYNPAALKETADISNKSGVKLVSDFYASSNSPNVALSPPTMVATFSALAHMGRGKTKEELQKLLSLDGNENPSFGLLGRYLKDSFEYYPNADETTQIDKINAQLSEIQAQMQEISDKVVGAQRWQVLSRMPEYQKLQNESQTLYTERQKLQAQAEQRHKEKMGDEYQRLGKELDELAERLDEVLDASGMPLSVMMHGGSSGTYDSIGYLLVNSRFGNVGSAVQREFLDKFGTQFESTDFSEAGVKKFNDGIKRIVEDVFDDVIESNPDQAMIVCSAMNLFLSWGIIMKEDTLLFNFDRGRRRIDCVRGDLQVRNITVNSKAGHLFPLGLSDLMIVKCRNSAELRQLARAIAADGLRVESVGNRLRTASLYIPTVAFQTKFDFQEYAKAKGLSVPFTQRQATYALSDNLVIQQPCDRADVESLFQVDMAGITLKQVTFAGIPMPIGRDMRIPERIIIDSPYLMIITERNLGTVLGMAFIANPEFDEGW